MIKNYIDKDEFINDNIDYLLESPLETEFMQYDSKLFNLENDDKLIKVFYDNRKLIFMRVKPYNSMLYGDKTLCEELINYLISNDIEVENILAEDELAKEFLKLYCMIKGYKYKVGLSMDILKVESVTEPSDLNVKVASLLDVDEIYNDLLMFKEECNLNDEMPKESIIKYINDFYVYKEDGKIISIARKSRFGSKITSVFTINSKRGQGYAKKVVNYVKNKLLETNSYVSLYVDKNNPISNKLYYDLGFRKVISQSEYRKEK